jgi:hypothetical protein
MADDVTRKDLQALQTKVDKQIADLAKQQGGGGSKEVANLQAVVNRQIADLGKRIDELRREFNKGLDEENRITVNVRGDVTKRLDRMDDRFSQVQDSINALSRGIGELAKKVH